MLKIVTLSLKKNVFFPSLTFFFFFNYSFSTQKNDLLHTRLTFGKKSFIFINFPQTKEKVNCKIRFFGFLKCMCKKVTPIFFLILYCTCFSLTLFFVVVAQVNSSPYRPKMSTSVLSTILKREIIVCCSLVVVYHLAFVQPTDGWIFFFISE